MNRSIEIRLKRLEGRSAPEKPPRRSHMFAAKTDAERDAAIADLVAAGAADPDDLFIILTPSKPDPTSHMHQDYRWDETAGHWVRKDGRDDAAIARLSGAASNAESRES